MFKRDNSSTLLCDYENSDCGGDVVDTKSTMGYVFKLFSCNILWANKKQQTVSVSSTESEYIALTLAITEAY